jgi:hypothetical protein
MPYSARRNSCCKRVILHRFFDAVSRKTGMENLQGCQIPNLQRIAEGEAQVGPQPLIKRFKRALAKPWNYHGKKWLKKTWSVWNDWKSQPATSARAPAANPIVSHFKAGDLCRVRSKAEIQATLNPWKELKGCAFLDDMWQYCDTTQHILQPLERFLDERDYKVKKSKGIVLLENAICRGTPVFGRCDRCCFLFWREEWLEKISSD